MDEFTLHGESIDLCALLKAAGICATGGEAKGMIRDELVRVDGEVELRLRRKIRSGMRVEVAGRDNSQPSLSCSIHVRGECPPKKTNGSSLPDHVSGQS